MTLSAAFLTGICLFYFANRIPWVAIISSPDAITALTVTLGTIGSSLFLAGSVYFMALRLSRFSSKSAPAAAPPASAATPLASTPVMHKHLVHRNGFNRDHLLQHGVTIQQEPLLNGARSDEAKDEEKHGRTSPSVPEEQSSSVVSSRRSKRS